MKKRATPKLQRKEDSEDIFILVGTFLFVPVKTKPKERNMKRMSSFMKRKQRQQSTRNEICVEKDKRNK